MNNVSESMAEASLSKIEVVVNILNVEENFIFPYKIRWIHISTGV